MTYHDKLKDQVKALTTLLECFISLVEDMERSIKEENGADTISQPDDTVYIIGRRSGLIQKNELVA